MADTKLSQKWPYEAKSWTELHISGQLSVRVQYRCNWLNFAKSCGRDTFDAFRNINQFFAFLLPSVSKVPQKSERLRESLLVCSEKTVSQHSECQVGWAKKQCCDSTKRTTAKWNSLPPLFSVWGLGCLYLELPFWRSLLRFLALRHNFCLVQRSKLKHKSLQWQKPVPTRDL